MERNDGDISFELEIFLASDFVQIQGIRVHELDHLADFGHHQNIRSSSQLFTQLFIHDHDIVLADPGHVDRVRKLVGLSAVLFIGRQQLLRRLELNTNHGFKEFHESLSMLTVLEEEVDTVLFFLDFDTLVVDIVL